MEALFSQNRKVLIAYITVGYPHLEATVKAVTLLERSGVDMVELGIPFSDPLVDGITIQQASYTALKNGTTPGVCLEIAGRIKRGGSALPLVFMTYYNPILSYGLELFCADSARAGIDGLIVPDLPLEEAGCLEEAAARNNLALVYLVAPTSSEERIEEAARRSRGFIYLVSVTGVTGMRKELPPGLVSFAARVRRRTSKPLCMGFGISSPQQARMLAGCVDGIIVGSSIVHLMGNLKDWEPALADLARSFKKALRAGGQKGQQKEALEECLPGEGVAPQDIYEEGDLF